MHYPHVLDESATIDRVIAGESLTRFGDGEFKIILGGHNVSQNYDPALARELEAILRVPQKFCMVGIPDMNPESPKWWFWGKHKNTYRNLLSPKIDYVSSFVTRPDSAPKIDKDAYYSRVEDLWNEQEVVLVRGSARSLVEDQVPMNLAKRVHPVLCARRDAYLEIERVEEAVLALNVKRVLLCAGAMATALTYRLAKRGLHAVDLGHIGFLWRSYGRANRA